MLSKTKCGEWFWMLYLLVLNAEFRLSKTMDVKEWLQLMSSILILSFHFQLDSEISCWPFQISILIGMTGLTRCQEAITLMAVP